MRYDGVLVLVPAVGDHEAMSVALRQVVLKKRAKPLYRRGVDSAPVERLSDPFDPQPAHDPGLMGFEQGDCTVEESRGVPPAATPRIAKRVGGAPIP